MDNSILETLLSKYNWWMGVSTIAVASGILGEYVAHFVFEREAKRSRIELTLAILFGVLVLGGVVGEYIFGSKLSDVAGQLQRAADAEVAKLNDSAAQATKDAAIARKEAESFQSQIADANARAKGAEAVVATANAASRDAVLKVSSAEARIAEAQRDAAQAREQAAKSNEVAERERLARLQLEARLSPRSLSNQQEINISNRLRGFGGRNLDIIVIGGTPEIVGITWKIVSAVQGAGWKVRVWSAVGPDIAVSGILVATKRGSESSTEGPADAIIAALKAEGIVSNRWTQQFGDELPMTLNGPIWDSKNIAPIRMMVGTKP